jgi:7,8-dihydropterin-6-yl-methyl-4-(beta-D-ribofuranosyl)aminobenzene 5'-phosphate synthase
MSETIIVTVLVENSVQGRELMAEHGLAFHVQCGAESLLFDTGQSALLVENARRLGLDLPKLRAVALSHGHYDHAGGLRAVWRLAPDAPLYLHPAALAPRFARNPDGTTRDVGLSGPDRAVALTQALRGHASQARTEVLPGFSLTGEIPRETNFEDVGGPFVLDEAGTQPDPIVDDQALFFDTRDGVVVLLGCAHAGVVNTLRHVRRLTSDRPIHAVLGGMHLLVASPERLEATVQALREMDVPRLGPAHCTGAAATARLWHEFPKACTLCSVGSRFVFQR